MLIAEQLTLLCIDPRQGGFVASHAHADINTLLAAALILDLFEQRRLRFKNGYIAIETVMPITHPHLGAAAHVLAGPVNGLPVAAALELLVARLSPISRHLLESLFRRDVLHRVRESWWPWSRLHFPLRSIQARNEASSQLHKAATEDATDLRGMGLLMLTDLAGELEHSLTGDAHEIAAGKLLHLADHHSGANVEQELLVSLRRTLMA
jgi:hypothetical protein